MFIGANVQAELKKLISSARKVDMAVAFWGDGAIRSLGLSKKNGRKVRVVCDLYSGACNPHELREMTKIGCRLFHKKRMHAKVYLTERRAIVGSSNASANGLGFEGDELSGNIEASFAVKNTSQLKSINNWFERVAMKGAVPIKPAMLRQATKVWLLRRRMRGQATGERKQKKSLWNELVTNPLRFRDRRFFLAVYDSEYSEATKKKVKEYRSELRDRKIDAYELLKGNRVRAGDILLDVFKNRRGPRFLGIFKIAEDLDRIRFKRHEVVFCRELSNFEGIYCSRSDERKIEDYVRNNDFELRSLHKLAAELSN